MQQPDGPWIAFVGRAGRLPRRRVAAAAARAGVVLRPRLARRCTALALGHGAVDWPLQRLGAVVERADALAVPVVSEHALLRRLGLLPAAPAEARPYTITDIAAAAALPPATVRLLALLDLIGDGGGYGFRDLKAARDFARLAGDTDGLEAALRQASRARADDAHRRHMAALDLAERPGKPPVLDLDTEPPSFADAWAAADSADEAGEPEAAEAGFRRCAGMRPRDAGSLYRLALVCAERAAEAEARDLLRRSVALAPGFADAHLELARLAEDGDARRLALERAVAAAPDHGPALHDLADLCTAAGDYAAAQPLWERFLATAAAAPRAGEAAAVRRARRALLLCRMARLQARTPDRARG